MTQNTSSHRRILAAPATTADPTQRKPKNHHPQPDPTIPDPPPLSTIQNISHRFSRLYANHKKQVSSHSFSKPGPHFLTRKDPFFAPVSDSSRTTATNTLSKSSSLKDRNDKKHHLGAKTKPKEKPDVLKKPFCAEKIASFEEVNNNRRRSSVVNEGGGRRRSFCNSQVELADFLSCSGLKVVAVDMPPFMQVHAVDCARKAHDSLEKFTSKTLACTLKKEFDGVYGPAWHCIVGTSFGSFVTHSVGGFMYFSMDHKLYILLFKTTVQKADD